MVLSHPFEEDCLALLLSMPLYCPPGDQCVIYLALCLQVVSQASQTSDLLRSKLLVRVALLASVSAQLFPFTPACSGQYTQQKRLMRLQMAVKVLGQLL